MKQINIEELQWFITSVLERDEYMRIWSENDLDNPEHIKGDDYVIGVAVGVSRVKKALEKYLSCEHVDMFDFICKKAGIKSPYLDGDEWCILIGDDLQSGIAGFGRTKTDALVDLLKNYSEMQKQPEVNLDALVDEAFDKYGSFDGYGQFVVSFNCAELYSFIKKITRKED